MEEFDDIEDDMEEENIEDDEEEKVWKDNYQYWNILI